MKSNCYSNWNSGEILCSAGDQSFYLGGVYGSFGDRQKLRTQASFLGTAETPTDKHKGGVADIRNQEYSQDLR